jgi:hypothetical protein
MLKVLLFGASLAFLTSNSHAGEAETAKAQAIIKSQIEAFKSGQDAAAYSYASPTIQGYFPEVSAFMNMVKKGYQPLYSPKSYDFGRSRDVGGGQIVQELFVTGPDGKPWTAIYTLIPMPDGTMKINGVQLLPGDDSSA